MSSMDMDRYLEVIRDGILEHGHMVQYVAAERGEIPWAYTVGRTLCDRPEFLISGPFSVEVAQELLNRAVEVDTETPVQSLRPVYGIANHAMLPMEIDMEPLTVVLATFGIGRCLQLIWPDRNGLFPGEEGCSLSANVQEICRRA